MCSFALLNVLNWAKTGSFTQSPSAADLGYGYGLCAGIFKQSKGARNRVRIGLLYQPARLHSLTELVPWKLESILGLPKV